jgi:hypothetical protein
MSKTADSMLRGWPCIHGTWEGDVFTDGLFVCFSSLLLRAEKERRGATSSRCFWGRQTAELRECEMGQGMNGGSDNERYPLSSVFLTLYPWVIYGLGRDGWARTNTPR